MFSTMSVCVYSIHDSKAGAFLQPFFSPNDDTAKRDFGYACNDPEHAFYRSAQDFTLFFIGRFDSTDGRLEGVGPNPVCNGVELRKLPVEAMPLLPVKGGE